MSVASDEQSVTWNNEYHLIKVQGMTSVTWNREYHLIKVQGMTKCHLEQGISSYQGARNDKVSPGTGNIILSRCKE